MKIDFPKKRVLFTVVGLALGFFFIALSVRHMDWLQVFHALSKTQLYPWFIFAVGSYLVGHFIRGIRTKLIISRDARLSVLTSSNIVITGYAVNNVIPARIGELARVGMLCERTGIDFMQSATVVVAERTFDWIAIIILLVAATFISLPSSAVQQKIIMPLFIALPVLALILFAALAPNRIIGIMSKAIYVLRPGWHDATMKLTTSFVNGVAYLGSPLNSIRIFSLSILVWLCDAGLFLFLMPAFDVTVNIWHAIFIMAIANLGVFFFASPGYSSPGHVGPFHALCMQALDSLGIDKATGFNFAMVAHLAIYLSIMLWGGIVALWYGITLGTTITLKKKAKPILNIPDQVLASARQLGATTGSAINESSSIFIYKVTEAVVPLKDYKLSNPQNVVSYTADFVQGEIRNLSKKLQFLFGIGMLGFNLLIWCRYLHAFSQLPLVKRIDIFNSWAYGKYSVARQLFKLIRSTALLAFFEHPDVIRTLEQQSKNT